MRYWIDTEFIEDGKTIDLISIGIVAQDGREMYIELEDADLSRASPWVRENVIPHLEGCRCESKGLNACNVWWRSTARLMVMDFCDPELYGIPEFWGYYADYDWVALCQLFGTMLDLPTGWPMYCRDLRQEADRIGIEGPLDQYVPVDGEHHALADARWNRRVHEFVLIDGDAPWHCCPAAPGARIPPWCTTSTATPGTAR